MQPMNVVHWPAHFTETYISLFSLICAKNHFSRSSISGKNLIFQGGILMKRFLLIAVPLCALVMLFSLVSFSQTISEGQGESDENPVVSYEFEQGDVLATTDDELWQIGKIMEEGGKGKDRELKVLFANGEEAWVKPAYVKKSVSMIKRNELRVGSAVFYTTSQPGDFTNHSIRFVSFRKGKITSIGKLHRDVITVNSDEVNWKTQVVMAK